MKVKQLKPAVKATLEYDLTTEDGQFEFRMATRGKKFYFALLNVAQDLFRQKRKYGEQTEYNIIALEEEFYDILEDQGIKLYDEEV